MLLQSSNTCCKEVQLLKFGVQIVVSDVGATIPGINSTEDKLGFLYEACSASLKVSLSFVFSSLQQQTDLEKTCQCSSMCFEFIDGDPASPAG